MAARSNLDRAVWIAVAALIVLRGFVFVFYEQAHFDSDQAVLGIMAKDLAGLKAFPFFIYGQRYLFAISVWLQAPIIAAFGASVWALKLPLLAMNLLVALLIFWNASRDGKLSAPIIAIASLFFVIPAIIPASRLVEDAGGNIEPFVAMLLLWTFRDRPKTFGLILAVAILNRPFAIYAVVAIAALDWLRKRRIGIFNLQTGTTLTLTYGGLRALSNLGANSFGRNGTGIAMKPPGQFASGLRWLLTENLPVLFGFRREKLSDFNIGGSFTAGNGTFGIAATVAILAILARTVFLARQDRAKKSEAGDFALYLIVVGVLSVAGYLFAAAKIEDPMLIRYDLLFLLAPVGLFLLFFVHETRQEWRVLGIAIAFILAEFNAASHVRLIAEYVENPPPNPQRELAQYLVGKGIHYGRAPYWTAYAVSFLSDERVKLTTSDQMRIEEYDALYRQHANDAVEIGSASCANGVRAGGLYVCPQK